MDYVRERNMKRAVVITLFGMFSLVGLAGCNEGVCLSHGENCAQSYIDANYGGVRPPCCSSSDQCQSSYSGYLTCN